MNLDGLDGGKYYFHNLRRKTRILNQCGEGYYYVMGRSWV